MDTDLVIKLMHGYKVSYLLFYAVEKGLFDYLIEKTSAAEVCKQANFPFIEKMQIILDVFTGIGLVKKDEKLYCLHPDYADLLNSRSKGSVIHLLHLEKFLMEHHNRYENLVFSLEQDAKDNFNERDKENMEGIYGQAMENGGRFAAHHIGRIFRQLKKDTPQILDIGGGIGSYSISIVTYLKNAKVDIFERPEMHKDGMENILRHNMENSISYHTIDIREDNINKKYDGILMSNVLHLYDHKTVETMLGKAAGILNDNGLLILHDFFLKENHSEPMVPLLFTIDWMLIGSNFNYSPKDMETIGEPFGLRLVEVKTYQEIPTCILVFRKELM